MLLFLQGTIERGISALSGVVSIAVNLPLNTGRRLTTLSISRFCHYASVFLSAAVEIKTSETGVRTIIEEIEGATPLTRPVSCFVNRFHVMRAGFLSRQHPFCSCLVFFIAVFRLGIQRHSAFRSRGGCLQQHIRKAKEGDAQVQVFAGNMSCI